MDKKNNRSSKEQRKRQAKRKAATVKMADFNASRETPRWRRTANQIAQKLRSSIIKTERETRKLEKEEKEGWQDTTLQPTEPAINTNLFREDIFGDANRSKNSVEFSAPIGSV